MGETLRGQQLYQQAAEAYSQAAWQPATSPELKRRSLLAAGEAYDLMNEHFKASEEYQQVINAGSDSPQADLARKYQRSAYSAK
jgi:hypothetical protein